MKIKCTVIFVFDSGDQTLKECKEYLKNCPGEALEWMGDDTTFVFEDAENRMTDMPKALAVLDRIIGTYFDDDNVTDDDRDMRKARAAFAELVASDKEYDEAKAEGSRSGVVSDEDVDAIGFALIKAGWRPPLGKGETSVRATLQSIAPPKASAVPDVQAMVNQFLSWRLPNDFAPDAGISFNPGPTQHLPHCWPTGTCLFTAAQAEQMIRYMLAAPQPKVQP